MALKAIPEIPQDYEEESFEDQRVPLRPLNSSHQLDSATSDSLRVDLEFEDLVDNSLSWASQPLSLERSPEKLELGFNTSPRPWLPPKLLRKLEKMKRTPLKRKEMVELMEGIAEISIDFYDVRHGTCIAMRLSDGRIVETADTEIDLLLKIQGKKFGTPVFVWQAGSKSFTGWRT